MIFKGFRPFFVLKMSGIVRPAQKWKNRMQREEKGRR
nr:MAG TPA: hypothetical protein [Caudoviricetes sp.]